ncbi:hypothetical protein SJAV_16160 [Sulfurisphaera javensis]|uniref:Uncharacterized protein n=1 Tax=Sulfurisphaera javensis TaxID=2049879 RepID=A0AAT9GSS4_9CREN
MKITFVILSLIFMLIDEPIALLTLERIYGYKVYSLALSLWFLIPYSLLIFFIEYMIVSSLSLILAKFLHFLKHLRAFH